MVLAESQDGLGEGTRLTFLQPTVCVSSTEIMFTMSVCALVPLSDQVLAHTPKGFFSHLGGQAECTLVLRQR